MGEVEPEMDTSALTQVDQYLHGQQVQAMNCTADHQPCIDMNPLNKQLLNQSCTSSKLQPVMSNSPLPNKNTVNQYTQTMFDNHPPQKTKSSTLPQQGTASSLDCSPPRSFSVGSEATVAAIEPNEFTCSESEMRQKELERKSRTMQNILKEELHLNPTRDSSQKEPRKRVASVPAKNLKNITK